MPKLNYKQLGDELVNIAELCLYSNETAEINFEVDFPFSHAFIFLNKQGIGKVYSKKLSIHASRFRDGANELRLSFYAENNTMIRSFVTTVVKRPSLRGAESIEQEFSLLTEQIGKLQNRLSELEQWRKNIDNERSGF